MADYEFISLTIKGVTDSDEKGNLTIIQESRSWKEGEPSGAKKIFTTKQGNWVAPTPNLLVLMNSENKRVGELNGFIFANISKGDSGQGKCDETGVIFKWTAT